MRQFITLVEAAARPNLDDAAMSAFSREIETRFGLKAFFCHLSHHGDIKLASIIAGENGQGRGTAALTALCALADAHGRRIVLTPGQPDDRHGTTSTARLKRFYKRFGFVENTGRRKDFSISATMLRDPR